MPPLNALRAFEAAARLGRMTAAAEELSVTPGAISRQVQLLEVHLGQRLFEGSKNKPQLTHVGQTLWPALSRAFDSVEAAVQAVTDDARGTLDVVCFSTFTVKWLIPRLFSFNAQYPDIEVRLRTSGQQSDLERSRCDLTITVETDEPGVNIGQDSAITLPLFQEWLGPVLAPQLNKGNALRTPTDLVQHTLLQSKTRMNAWRMWASAHGCELPSLNGVAYEHYYFTLQAAIAGLGVCVAPWHLVADDVEAGRLLAPLGFCESGYRYVAKRRSQRSQKLSLFCQWLQTQAAQSTCPVKHLSSSVSRSAAPI